MANQPFKKMSLIERCALTFESFLDRDFATRFYQPEFLDGIAARRLEIAARVAKTGSQTFLLATVLAFFDLIAGSSFSYGGLTVQITKDLTPVISLITASSLLGAIFAMIDDQIIFRILLKLGGRINIQSFPLLLIDKMAHNLWGDAIVPRVFGEKSGKGQALVVSILKIVVGLISSCMLFYPVFMVSRVFFDITFSDARWIAKALASLAMAVVIWAVFLAGIFMIKFKFYPADWYESTNLPTKEFEQRMREEIAGKTGGSSAQVTT
ncbi:hypothetical protein EOA32_10915 [Mesorhizobium sp. M1A.F.Ca.ET.072.01.1.1]|uniref:hypothetical protein n=1 Tax=Mesorhizobium sp. M1A.F.Ca.ET.072.01.1.1 TaxID=2496753 RepID=UPI000FD25696|nr:hypothetical protein [Mesorhizobium sp. M1A.F.Ca.ET.072.01.1.1]RUW52986.1 hypothetical protein EOA32_10915 [Mesorhizobium sp. M1A.F.Ca.ET.072.01.1.1]TIV04360.1 MAG: hypothetical protein E5W04_04040 [Mesorhizobium sp.]